MTANVQQEAQEQTKNNDKELNFRTLETKYNKQLEQERAHRLDLELQLQEIKTQRAEKDDDDNDGEPYVDHKRLNKTLAKHSEQTKQQTQSDIIKAMQQVKQQANQEVWLENNPDFYETLEGYSAKLVERSPALAKSI